MPKTQARDRRSLETQTTRAGRSGGAKLMGTLSSEQTKAKAKGGKGKKAAPPSGPSSSEDESDDSSADDAGHAAENAALKAQLAALQKGSVAASIGGDEAAAATTGALADVFADLPATVPVAVHQPKPAAKNKAKRRKFASDGSSAAGAGSDSDSNSDSDDDADADLSRKQKAMAKAFKAGAAAEEEDVLPGWKARMVAEKGAGITKNRDGKTPQEVRAEREATAEARTVFVGNLPLTHAKKKPLRKLFIECGVIESVRFRSFTVSDLRMPKKAAFINSAFHEQRDSCNAYVVFKSTDAEVIEAALAKNNDLVEGHHIRVDRAARKSDAKDGANKRSVFVGNLPFDVTEESLRAHFEDAGLDGVDNVRIVRDPRTGLGKGIAFVGFESEETAVAALALHESKFGAEGKANKGRELRVFRASAKLASQAHKRGHTSDGHSGTVGNPNPRDFGGGRGRGGDFGGRGGRGGRGGDRGGGRGSVRGPPAWQGQRSEPGYVPSEMSNKRKKAGDGGHSTQKRKPQRRTHAP